MKKPEYQNYRVCYDNGNSSTGARVYSLYKYCKCQDCNSRHKLKREPQNWATATTKDISRIDEIADFLNNWACENGKAMILEPSNYKF